MTATCGPRFTPLMFEPIPFIPLHRFPAVGEEMYTGNSYLAPFRFLVGGGVPEPTAILG